MGHKYQRALDLLNSFKRLYGEKIVKIIGATENPVVMQIAETLLYEQIKMA